MLIPPKYTFAPKISQLLQSIEASKEVINSVSIPPEIEMNIRRKSTLKSSLFSARIEGNDLTLDQLPKRSSQDQKRIEVFNILKGLNLIYQRSAKDLSLKDILNLHQIILEKIADKESLGKFRVESSAIFNSAGIAVYLPPGPSQIVSHVNKLLTFVNSNKEQFVPIRACLTHYIFEKIHPFSDGNGRVGRLLLQLSLAKGGYGMKGLLALEEYLDQDRASYYKALDEPEKDTTDYVEFMLQVLAKAAEDVKKQILGKKQTSAEDYLLPRRLEILNIIRDHRSISFDEIKRRFLSVNGRTLRYDLKKLADQGLIRKRGSTKGVYYEINNP